MGARAEAIAEFLFAELRRTGRPVAAAWQGGRARHLALAADYAWLVECCTRLGELTGRAGWTGRASEVADGLLDLFWDGPPPADSGDRGGLFTTGHDAEALIVRPKDLLDGAVPSANSVGGGGPPPPGGAVRRGLATAAAGERIVELAAPLLTQHPSAVADLVAATALADAGAEVVVAGDRPDLLAVVRRRWLPGAVLAWGEPRPRPCGRAGRPGSAYVCRQLRLPGPGGRPGDAGPQLDAHGGTSDAERPA